MISRNESSIKIQKSFRNFKYRKMIRSEILLEKSQFHFDYPFKAKSILLKLFTSENRSQIFPFTKCSLQKKFILTIDPKNCGISEKIYKCHFIVDGVVTCDGRYDHFEGNDGLYYNLIDFSTKLINRKES